jgi:hypothetical protein
MRFGKPVTGPIGIGPDTMVHAVLETAGVVA